MLQAFVSAICWVLESFVVTGPVCTAFSVPRAELPLEWKVAPIIKKPDLVNTV